MSKHSFDLIGRYFDDHRTPETCEELESWLAESPENVRQFVEHMLVNNDVQRYVLAEDLKRYDEAVSGALPKRRVSESPVQPTFKRTNRGSLVVAAFATAACLMLMFSWIGSNRGLEAELAQSEAVDSPAPIQATPLPEKAIESERSDRPAINFVATVSDSKDCVWGESSTEMEYGRHLDAGADLDLKQGLVQLTFETGAVAIAEGPCRLIVGSNSIELALGKLTATVPRDAKGFSVETPNSEIVDLGTEFGINVDAKGGTEIHVFKGEVISRRKQQSGRPAGKFVRLRADSAIAFRRSTKQAEEFAANEAAFTRRLRHVEQEGLPTVSPVAGDLLLWLAADHATLLDGSGGVVAWLDTLTDSSNRVADNALQPQGIRRPRLIDSAIGGLPALRFDGKDDSLTTTPMTNGSSQTIAFVAAFDTKGKLKGNLINYNGPPQVAGMGDASIALQNKLSILQIRACRLKDARFPVVDPYVYAGHWKGNELFVGRMEFQSRTASKEHSGPDFGDPFVAVYVYDKAGNRAELFVNGRSYGRSTAPLSAAITSRKVIARHGHWPDYFRGDIAEMMIYDEGLDQERVGQLTAYLATKYSISAE